jgi:hypothetical protein
MRRIIYALVFIKIFSGCASHDRSNVSASSWDNALMVSEQRLEIERLRNDFHTVGFIIRDIADRNEGATRRLVDSLGRVSTIEAIIDAMDDYVRTIETENRQLRNLLRTNWGENVGEG